MNNSSENWARLNKIKSIINSPVKLFKICVLPTMQAKSATIPTNK